MSTPISELPATNDQALFEELINEIDPTKGSQSASMSSGSSDALYKRQMLDTSIPSQGDDEPEESGESLGQEEERGAVRPNTEYEPLLTHEGAQKQSPGLSVDWGLQLKYALTVGVIVFLFCMPPMDHLIKMIPKLSSGANINIMGAISKSVLAALLFFGIDSLYRMQT